MKVSDVLEQTVLYLKRYIELLDDKEEIQRVEENIEDIEYHINIIK